MVKMMENQNFPAESGAKKAARICAYVLILIPVLFALLEMFPFCVIFGAGSYDPRGIAAFLYFMLFLVPPLFAGVFHLLAVLMLAVSRQCRILDPAWYIAAFVLLAGDVSVLFLANAGLMDTTPGFTIVLFSSLILHLALGVFSVLEIGKNIKQRKKTKKAPESE